MTSVDAAAIYVRAEAVTAERVRDVVEAYWLARGAYRGRHSPWSVDPLSVQTYGSLGFGFVREPDAAGVPWVVVADTERYVADDQLARHLHETLRTDVVAYCLSESVDRGWWLHLGAGEERTLTEPASVRDAVAGMPRAFWVMGDRSNSDEDDFAPGMALLRLEGIGLEDQPHAHYHGPALDSQPGKSLIYARGSHLRQQADAEGFSAWADRFPDMLESVLADVSRLGLDSAAAIEFVLGLQPRIEAIEHDHYRERASRKLAEAAFRAGRRDLFARLFDPLARDAKKWDLSAWLAALAGQGELALALEAFMLLHELGDVDPEVYNNLCYVAAKLDDLAARMATLGPFLEKAAAAGPTNPHIFHNLACVYLRLGEPERALDAVRDAIAYRYPLLDRLRGDDDLAPLHAHPRWIDAWAEHDERLRREREAATVPANERLTKTLLPHRGVEIDGVGTIGWDTDERLHELLGEPTNEVDASYGILRFSDHDLTVAPESSGRVLINHRPAHTTARILDVDPFATDPDEVLRLFEQHWGAPEIERDSDGSYERHEFTSVDVAVGRQAGPDDRAITSVSLYEPGRLRERQRKRNREARERETKRAQRAAQQHERLCERLRRYYATRSEQ